MLAGERFDVIVIGAGVIGSSIAMGLAERSLKTLAVDIDLSGRLSSSEKNAGGVRATWWQRVNIALCRASIEYYQRGFMKLRLDLYFLDLAAADDGGGIDFIAHLKNAPGNLGARTVGKFCEFGKRSALRFTRVHTRHMRCPLQAHTHQEYAFA